MGKRGPLSGSEKRGAPTGIRFDPDLKARLVDAKNASGRSFSDEASARLEASFRAIQFNDPATEAFAARIALALEIVREQTGHSWFDQAFAWKHAKDAIETILDRLSPGGSTTDVPDDAPVLRALRASGLDHLVPEARAQLAKADIGKLAGLSSLALGEAAAAGRAAAHLDHLNLFGDRLQARAHEFDNVGEKSALEELKRAADKPSGGVRL